ncbi:MAG: orotidine-5'-phosphate decarboxylase [Clostridiales bacterium]|nr:orotidine-5'-phosphate decarboxylase [Clostridiales bacterium]
MNKDVIIALDFPSAEKAMTFLSAFGSTKPYVKVGMELFYAEGADMVKRLKDMGHKVFLDLKLHDIPNTVKSAMSVLASIGADMCNLHASGTRAMMSAALEGLTIGSGSNPRPLLIAVTQLTSTNSQQLEEELLIKTPMKDTVISYAKNAQLAGLDGVVCSPLEAAGIKEACSQKFLTVTPGIRFEDSSTDDQSRIMTPAKARVSGSDFIVVGRPITKAENPVAAYERCVKDFML